jgi:hypothetical protein
MLTTSQAWAKIAEAYERKIFTGKKTSLTEYGLCHAVDGLQREGEIESLVSLQMETQIAEAKADKIAGMGEEWKPWTFDGSAHDPVYLWPYNAEGDQNRAILAQLFSEVTA